MKTSLRLLLPCLLTVFSISVAAQSSARRTNDVVARIREEGLNHSQVMETLSYLSDVIGPRLTGSPNLRRANEWTKSKLESWGLTQAHLEGWGPFGRGWSLQRFSAQLIEPQQIALPGYPKAWSPGLDHPIEAEVIHVEVKSDADYEKYRGKLQGAVVLISSVREVRERFDPLATRLGETNLLRLANAGPPTVARVFDRGTNTARSTNAPVRRNTDPAGRLLSFVSREGAAAVVTSSPQGDAGTFFISQATVPAAEPRETNAPPSTNAVVRPWAPDAPAFPPQIVLATEEYNRLVRMLKAGEKLKMALEMKARFHGDDLMAYNTVAEIPGSDLKDEIVMVGGHLDSWHGGTGATDNGAGVACAMEAVRILQALHLQPRRTVRVALWTGEEQGIYGSKAYVSNHFGYYPTATAAFDGRRPNNPGTRRSSAETNAVRRLVRQKEYEKLSVYFNLDNGTGKIRGVHMQGNEAVRPIFRKWLEPFYDLGAETLTLGNTGGTDHLSFDAIGLPGFQFIQDPMDYMSRTHHSNADVFDRIQGDDLRQASTIMAAFIYNAAMADERMPRKPEGGAGGR